MFEVFFISASPCLLIIRSKRDLSSEEVFQFPNSFSFLYTFALKLPVSSRLTGLTAVELHPM